MSVRESSDAQPVTEAVTEDVTQFTRWPGLMSLALCVLLGPIVALTHQQVIYMTGMWACGRGFRGALHLVPVLSLVVVIGAAYGGYRNWRAVGYGLADEDGSVSTRTRFLALLGITISVFSAI